MDDKNQLKYVGLIVLWGAIWITVLVAVQFLKISTGWMLLPPIFFAICAAYIRRGTMDEFERTGLHWARTWGSIIAVVVIFGLYLALLIAPEQMAPIKSFFVNSPRLAFESGLNAAFLILIFCWAGAHAIWWARHR